MENDESYLKEILDKDSKLNLNILEEHFIDLDLNEQIPDNEKRIQKLIKKYIELIQFDCLDEVFKKKLIKKLCELRIKLNELNEEDKQTLVEGHFLKLELFSNNCDLCNKKQKSLLPSLINNNNQLYACVYCDYTIHKQCQQDNVIRKCPKLIFEKQYLKIKQEEYDNYVILKICNEKGLSSQEYKCNDCKIEISFETSIICDYDGYYYCKNCHVNNYSLIPARIIHNWDFIPRPISKKSNYMLNYIKKKPILFNILKLNSMLYGFVDELSVVKRLRYELNLMIKYLVLCKQPTKPKITINNHLIEEEHINSYSLIELSNIRDLKKTLTDFHSELFEHITKNCEGCKGNGFYCELCPDKEDLLFPFSPNISLCSKCYAVYHKNCFYRKKICTRCKRISQKEDDVNENKEVLEVLDVYK